VNFIDPDGLRKITSRDILDAGKGAFKGAVIGGVTGATVGMCLPAGSGPGMIAGAALGAAIGAGQVLLPIIIDDGKSNIDQILDK
tara:strand:+ start:7567 stop:7821 length:255 start_codon:yes stop_codon:yes gene_type:complete